MSYFPIQNLPLEYLHIQNLFPVIPAKVVADPRLPGHAPFGPPSLLNDLAPGHIPR